MKTYQHWIGGQYVAPQNGDDFDVLNPLDDSVYAKAASGTNADVDRAVETADQAFRKYRHSLPKDREQWLLNAAELLQQQTADFVDILIDEVGSPITKAQKEVGTAIGILKAAAGTTRRLTGETIPTDVPGRMSLSIRQPIGVVAGMTPFNVPLIKDIKHSAMPLATGNTVVLLPSEAAPVMAHRVARLYAEAGIPDGVFNVVTGAGHEIGDRLATHPLVRMVGFTGSTKVGRHISALCGQHVKRCTLEMGGKNPLIVLKDADLAKALQGSLLGSFLYQGQICMASSRIYVERPLYDTFVESFTKAVRGIGFGDLRDAKTLIGPIINERQRQRVKTHLQDAVATGAQIQTGGQWVGNCCQPTVLTNVFKNAVLYREETFGPVTAIYPVDSADEALTRANDSNYGLSAAVYTSDLKSAIEFAHKLESGMVHVNGTTIQDEAHVPFGGVGDSGFGREGSEVSIDDLTEWKWITVQYA